MAKRLLTAALLLGSAKQASADTTPTATTEYRPGFAYHPGAGGASSVPSADLSDLALSANIDQLRQKLTRNTIEAVVRTDNQFMIPIGAALEEFDDAALFGDEATARRSLESAQKYWAEYESVRRAQAIAYLASVANTPLAVDLAKQFDDYAMDLKAFLDEAQAKLSDVRADASAYWASVRWNPDAFEVAQQRDEPGLRLLMRAFEFADEPYRRGMQCSDLIIKAAKAALLSVTEQPLSNERMTTTWFKQGLGPSFRQSFGGDDGVELHRLVDGIRSGQIKYSIGDVIVADGHVALIAGFVHVAGRDELIVYDSNDSVDLLDKLPPAVAGSAETADLLSTLPFRGHQVGEHVTRFQWNKNALVKLFSAIPRSP